MLHLAMDMLERSDMADPAGGSAIGGPGPPTTWMESCIAAAGRLLSFAVVAGIGWSLDMVIFTIGVHLGVPPLLANVVSASTAVTFVYWTSVRRIFHCQQDRTQRSFCGYLLLQVAIIAIASWMIAFIDHHIVKMPILAKVAVTPLCFLANYGGMVLLTRDWSHPC
jgi:putative flippase GtrA